MKCEVWKDKKLYFTTDHIDCVPDDRIQKQMKQSGYKVRIREGKDKKK